MCIRDRVFRFFLSYFLDQIYYFLYFINCGHGIEKCKLQVELFVDLSSGYHRSVSYTHLTLPTTVALCRYRWWPYN
nr:hypothetical protein [Elizabethkingia sp. ASV34]